MNCKQGDVAIIVKSLGENVGKIVTCKKFIGCVDGRRGYPKWAHNDYWEVDQSLPFYATETGEKLFVENLISDSHLRPLRNPGQDEEDEMIEIVKKNEFHKENY